MIRRGPLVGLAAMVLAAACAGCASAGNGSISSSPAGTNSGTSAAASPSQTTAPNTVSTSPTANPTTASRTYTFLGMTIALQAGWQPGAVVSADGTSFNGVVTDGPCVSSSFGSDCPGFMELFDPGYHLGQTFAYASGAQSGCPKNRGLMQVFPSGSQPVTTTESIGGRAVYLTKVPVLCINNSPSGGSSVKYTQRLWWIPSAQILVVDDGWTVSGLDGVLASATWASGPPTTPMMAEFTGSWHRHTDEFVINQNGFGTEVDGDGTCPNDPTSMCGFVAVLSFASTADGLKGTYTSVLPTVNGVINLTYTLDPSEPHQNDSFVLKADSHHRLQFTEVGHLTQFDGPDRKWLCNQQTPAQFNTCGA